MLGRSGDISYTICDTLGWFITTTAKLMPALMQDEIYYLYQNIYLTHIQTSDSLSN